VVVTYFERVPDGTWTGGPRRGSRPAGRKSRRSGGNPDASHLVGEKVTAESADLFTDGESTTGVVAKILRWTPDGGHVIVRLRSRYTVRIPRTLVEATAPRPRKEGTT